MTTWADDRTRVELAYQSITRMLDEVPSLVADWTSELSVDEQLAWSLEWDSEMAKLRHLVEADATGTLDPALSRRVRALAERAVAVLPLVERVNLRRPDEIVLAAGRQPISS